jgi:hypothetical protein
VNYGDGSGTVALALNPDKTFTFNKSYAAAGTYTVTVTVNDGVAGGTDTMLVTVSNSLNITGSAGTSYAITGPSGSQTMTIYSGTATFTGNAQSTLPNLTVHVLGGAHVVFDASQNLAGLVLDAGATAAMNANASRTLNVRSLTVSLAAGTKLDLSDNKLITSGAVGLYTGGHYTGITGLIESGRNGGGWGGSGIVTSQNPAITGSLTTIAVATAAQAKGIAPGDTAVWAGQTVTGSDTLVMYTYGGDANLDGKINVDDYGRVDSNIGLGIAGWYNGDFNYDGKVNVDDYGVIDSNIGIQGSPFFTAAGAVQNAGGGADWVGTSVVPQLRRVGVNEFSTVAAQLDDVL